VYICNSITWKAEAGRSQVWLHSKTLSKKKKKKAEKKKKMLVEALSRASIYQTKL
jgi:hypothetical protein